MREFSRRISGTGNEIRKQKRGRVFMQYGHFDNEKREYEVVVEQAISKKMLVSGKGTAMYVFNCDIILAQDGKVVDRRIVGKSGKRNPDE